MMRHGCRARIALIALGIGSLLCSLNCSSNSTPGIPKDITAVVFLQRLARNDGVGNVFDYTSFVPGEIGKPGGRLVKLEPPSPDGKLTVLTSDPMLARADIMAWDLSFDAKMIVFSARTAGSNRYHLFTMQLDGSNVRQITEGDRDYIYPIFVPGGRVFFMTNDVVEAGAPQFRDEYERQVTAQVGTMNQDGTGVVLGPRNVSHRVAPSLLPDGRVLFTEWRHLGDVNDGHLRIMNADMTAVREAFGGEGSGGFNSYLKARYVGTKTDGSGKQTYQVVTIATSRDRTLQAGKLLLVDLNGAEKLATAKDMTPSVPGDMTPSLQGVGRYYDAESVGNPEDQLFLASWADGPVQSELLAMAGTNPDFGLYLFNGKTGTRQPIFNDASYWDIQARPVKSRPEPPIASSPIMTGEASFTVGALNVFDSSIFNLSHGSAIKVRLMEGFSTEEGFPDMFGLSEFDGHSRLGEVPIYGDGSFAAKVPANVPIHLQLVDRFGLSMANEAIWFSGRAGEERFCGGCHEDRTKATVVAPGTTEAVQHGPVNLDTPRATRVSTDYSYDRIRGVPWDLAIQPIFDEKCADCHDGSNRPGNPTYTVVDMTTNTMQTFTFDLRGQKMMITVGERMTGDFTASYISLVGLEMEFGENQVMVIGNPKQYVEAGAAASSELIKKLNPPQRFPLDENIRLMPGVMPHPLETAMTRPSGKPLEALTPDEYYRLILNIDMGAQFFFRENKE